ncbi:MAG: MBL fold metallo-hydrolase [Candidatus Nealsonbacteria bacterium]|nr:MBL fold metallo-hydrolase [Candidatus Nealsonbacteria bacterium]
MRKNPVFIILGTLISFNLLAWMAVWELRGSGLEVTFFDVGQGDAAFIETPERMQILIDGGPTSVILEKLGKEMPFWDRTIDWIILTHPEKDHLSGLIEVLKSYNVKNILWTGIVRDTAEYREWQKLIKEEGAGIVIAKAGMCALSDSAQSCALSESAHVDILYPFESLEGKELKDSNDTSIIAKLVFGKISFLFTGDATQSVEKELVRGPTPHNLDSDVLKVGHHGSKTSTSKEFVKAVSPEVAVISAGKNNSYGHPHREVLDNLAGINILRTDLDGDIKIISDGVNYTVN